MSPTGTAPTEERWWAHIRVLHRLTGTLAALERTSPTDLGRFGIREHACEILDGGEEAFQKRREKYKIRAAG